VPELLVENLHVQAHARQQRILASSLASPDLAAASPFAPSGWTGTLKPPARKVCPSQRKM
jgi:hypothetical protein